jgi:uncharacterized membrane protein YczE
MKNKLVRYGAVLVGLNLVALGATLFITASIGAEAITVFMQGIMLITNTNFAFAIIVANAIPVSFLFILKRQDLLSFGSLAVLLIGPLIDFWLLTGVFNTPSTFINQFGLASIGILITSFGLALYIHANVGMAPFEALVVALYQKFKTIKFFYIKIAFDVIFLTLGYLLGGVVGIGTVVSVLAFGPVINFYLYIMKKINLFAI